MVWTWTPRTFGTASSYKYCQKKRLRCVTASEWLQVGSCQKMMGISRDGVLKLIEEGHLKTVLFGDGTILVHPDAVVRYVKQIWLKRLEAILSNDVSR